MQKINRMTFWFGLVLVICWESHVVQGCSPEGASSSVPLTSMWAGRGLGQHKIIQQSCPSRQLFHPHIWLDHLLLYQLVPLCFESPVRAAALCGAWPQEAVLQQHPVVRRAGISTGYRSECFLGEVVLRALVTWSFALLCRSSPF